MQQETQESDKDQYDELVEDFEELSESYYDQRVSDEPTSSRPHLTAEFTGLRSGVIRDAKSESEHIKLTIENNSTRETIYLRNTGTYTQNNEFARFLEWYNIHIEDPTDLFGTNVTIEETEGDWSIHMPASLDKYSKIGFYIDNLARYVGCQSLRKQQTIYDFIMPTLILTWMYSMITISGLGMISSVTGYEFSPIVFLGIFVSLFALGSAVARTIKILQKDIREKKNKTSIR